MLAVCACGAQRTLPDSGEAHIDWCHDCGTGATVPPPARDLHGDGLFEDPSAGYGGDRLANRKQWLREARVRLEWLQQHVPQNARIVEVGAATGEFVAVAESAGYAVVGLESSPWAARRALELTDRVEAVDLDHWLGTHPGAQFDVLVMFHVLEHFDEPRPFLRTALDSLVPGGCFLIEVPNGASSAATEQGGRWWAARLEDHYFHYTAQGLATLLRDCGWEVESVEPMRLSTYNTTWRRAAKRAKGLFRRMTFAHGAGEPDDLLRAVARRPGSCDD